MESGLAHFAKGSGLIVSRVFTDSISSVDARYTLLAPGLIEQSWSEAEALGASVWLWMQSPMHRSLPLVTLHALLLPAIKRRQFVIASRQNQPLFYAAWAHFDVHAEARYLARSAVHMPAQDWTGGPRLWALAGIAPFGHTRDVAYLLTHGLFAQCWGRALDHRGSQRGLRVRTFRGVAVPPEDAHRWFAANPVQMPETQPTTTPLAEIDP